MSHKPQKQQFDFKHGPPPEFDEELLKRIDEAVKPDNRDNQGESDGRDTEKSEAV